MVMRTTDKAEAVIDAFKKLKIFGRVINAPDRPAPFRGLWRPDQWASDSLMYNYDQVVAPNTARPIKPFNSGLDSRRKTETQTGQSLVCPPRGPRGQNKEGARRTKKMPFSLLPPDGNMDLFSNVQGQELSVVLLAKANDTATFKFVEEKEQYLFKSNIKSNAHPWLADESGKSRLQRDGVLSLSFSAMQEYVRHQAASVADGNRIPWNECLVCLSGIDAIGVNKPSVIGQLNAVRCQLEYWCAKGERIPVIYMPRGREAVELDLEILTNRIEKEEVSNARLIRIAKIITALEVCYMSELSPDRWDMDLIKLFYQLILRNKEGEVFSLLGPNDNAIDSYLRYAKADSLTALLQKQSWVAREVVERLLSPSFIAENNEERDFTPDLVFTESVQLHSLLRTLDKDSLEILLDKYYKNYNSLKTYYTNIHELGNILFDAYLDKTLHNKTFSSVSDEEMKIEWIVRTSRPEMIQSFMAYESIAGEVRDKGVKKYLSFQLQQMNWSEYIRIFFQFDSRCDAYIGCFYERFNPGGLGQNLYEFRHLFNPVAMRLSPMVYGEMIKYIGGYLQELVPDDINDKLSIVASKRKKALSFVEYFNCIPKGYYPILKILFTQKIVDANELLKLVFEDSYEMYKNITWERHLSMINCFVANKLESADMSLKTMLISCHDSTTEISTELVKITKCMSNLFHYYSDVTKEELLDIFSSHPVYSISEIMVDDCLDWLHLSAKPESLESQLNELLKSDRVQVFENLLWMLDALVWHRENKKNSVMQTIQAIMQYSHLKHDVDLASSYIFGQALSYWIKGKIGHGVDRKGYLILEKNIFLIRSLVDTIEVSSRKKLGQFHQMLFNLNEKILTITSILSEFLSGRKYCKIFPNISCLSPLLTTIEKVRACTTLGSFSLQWVARLDLEKLSRVPGLLEESYCEQNAAAEKILEIMTWYSDGLKGDVLEWLNENHKNQKVKCAAGIFRKQSSVVSHNIDGPIDYVAFLDAWKTNFENLCSFVSTFFDREMYCEGSEALKACKTDFKRIKALDHAAITNREKCALLSKFKEMLPSGTNMVKWLKGKTAKKRSSSVKKTVALFTSGLDGGPHKRAKTGQTPELGPSKGL